MRAPRALPLLLSATLLLAGCTLSDPEESEENPADTPNDPALDPLLDPTPPTADPFTVTPDPSPIPDATPPAASTPAATPPATTPTVTPPAASPTAPTPTTPTPSPSTPPPATPPAPTPTPPPPTPTSPPTPPPPTSWPVEGSYARYTASVSRSSYDGGYHQTDRAVASWTFTGGDWRGTCALTTEEFVEGRGWVNSTSTRTYSASSPPHWPLLNTRSPPAEGQPVSVSYLDRCDIAQDSIPYAGTDSETTTRNGQPYQAPSHLASLSTEQQGFRTEWSRSDGLVLSWGYSRLGGAMTTNFQGRLTDTDAPMT